MNILAFLKGLVPSFTKKDIREKIRNITTVLNTVVTQANDLVADTFNELAFKSAYGKNFTKSFVNYIGSPFKTDKSPFTSALAQAVTNGLKLLEQIQAYVDKNLTDTVHIEGLTYQKATALRLIELMDFFADYSIRHLNYLVASETNIDTFGHSDGIAVTKAELKYLDNNRAAYTILVGLLTLDPKKIMDKLDTVPEIMVADSDSGTTPALMGGNADPLHLASIPGISFIFHWIGIRKVDWDLARFERAQKELVVIQLRLESYRQKQAGNPDARTESFIEGYERELILVRDKISRFEASI